MNATPRCDDCLHRGHSGRGAEI